MSAKRRQDRRTRLDQDARARILGEIEALDAAPEKAPELADLREIILDLQSPSPEAVEPPPEPPAEPPMPDIAANRARLAPITVNPAQLDDNLIITAARDDPAHGAFDVLRTRMVQAMAERGWKRVGITSPTKGCGKSFTALNLAVTMSRYGGHYTALLDLDLHFPALARLLGVSDPGTISTMLRGRVSPVDHLRRFGPNSLNIGDNVALGLNGQREAYAAELFHMPQMKQALARIDADLAPDLMLFDLPPALVQDDVIALAPHFDCVLMVIGGGVTTAREVREALRRIGEDKPVLGMVLNKAEVSAEDAYRYAY